MIIRILPKVGAKWRDICLNLPIMELEKRLKISDLIRELRQQLDLSQEKFAAKLGVSLRTVNRWENGSTVPSQMALKLIEEMLQNMGEPGKRLLNEYLLKAEQREDS
ncbi:MAG: helix-turn-helix domain-containing protein [Nostoc sp. DedVER02]|uniref:helix-turn-helix domain-containing protein n=1 Tax=unclassified Nostoc TaxID=2593658 RepID=UPI002AD338A7|nr:MULTISPECIES: helix-turn-helix domain-containing protein [unclassified Nostoc]MDZ7987847.1 helix-turn-helix domain-containing protein [Nostoc sp. DedVER02]MDZ8116241.1 helix-turn-helix domain-containing protein [Nostoc sp. DedVER01b]